MFVYWVAMCCKVWNHISYMRTSLSVVHKIQECHCWLSIAICRRMYIYTHYTHIRIYIYSYVHICMHTHTPRLIYTCPYIWIIASRVICYCFHIFPVYSYCINDFSSMLSLLSWGAKHVFYSLIVWYVAFYLFLGYQVGWTFSRGCIVSCMC